MVLSLLYCSTVPVRDFFPSLGLGGRGLTGVLAAVAPPRLAGTAGLAATGTAHSDTSSRSAELTRGRSARIALMTSGSGDLGAKHGELGECTSQRVYDDPT
jgi:hypothetical protein